jgi:hypothetical protein
VKKGRKEERKKGRKLLKITYRKLDKRTNRVCVIELSIVVHLKLSQQLKVCCPVRGSVRLVT